ncbi:hypothetical protein Tco_0592286, partial [Tanacetum coccineum]
MLSHIQLFLTKDMPITLLVQINDTLSYLRKVLNEPT